MSPRTMLTLASGKMVDLLNPQAADVDFAVIAEQLAKEARYNGATPGVFYSVAQHSVLGADALFGKFNDRILAARFLVHDMPEHALRDDTTPKKRAIAAIAGARFGMLASQILEAFDELTAKWDTAIAEAAGLPSPQDALRADLIGVYDRRMLATEWRDLMRCPPPYDFGAAPLDLTIEPWTWQQAQHELLTACRRYLPVFQDRSAA